MRTSSGYISGDKITRMVSVPLACAFGVTEAFLIRQIQYWVDVKLKNPSDYNDSFIDGRCYVYNTYEKWHEQLPFLSDRTIRRALKNLEKLKVIDTVCHNEMIGDRTKWYAINYDELDRQVEKYYKGIEDGKEKLEQLMMEDEVNGEDIEIETYPCGQSGQMGVQNGQTLGLANLARPIPLNYTGDSNKKIHGMWNGAKLEKEPISVPNSTDFRVVKNQIRKSCAKYDRMDVSLTIQKIFAYYYSVYMEVFGEEHPHIRQKNIDSIIYRMIGIESDCIADIDYEDYKELIDQHFETNYGNDIDFNICHFMTEGIILNRGYELGRTEPYTSRCDYEFKSIV